MHILGCRGKRMSFKSEDDNRNGLRLSVCAPILVLPVPNLMLRRVGTGHVTRARSAADVPL